MNKYLFFSWIVSLLAACCEGQEVISNSLNLKPTSYLGINSMVEKSPKYLYKVVSLEDWAKSCKTVQLSEMDSEFIHLSTEEQLDRIIQKFWAKENQYIILKLETKNLPGDLVFEANPGGTHKYYHLYNGSIPLSAVSEMKVYKR